VKSNNFFLTGNEDGKTAGEVVHVKSNFLRRKRRDKYGRIIEDATPAMLTDSLPSSEAGVAALTGASMSTSGPAAASAAATSPQKTIKGDARGTAGSPEKVEEGAGAVTDTGTGVGGDISAQSPKKVSIQGAKKDYGPVLGAGGKINTAAIIAETFGGKDPSSFGSVPMALTTQVREYIHAFILTYIIHTPTYMEIHILIHTYTHIHMHTQLTIHKT